MSGTIHSENEDIIQKTQEINTVYQLPVESHKEMLTKGIKKH